MALRQHLPRYVLGLILLLGLLGHSAQIYRIGLIERLDAIYYDAKLRVTMPREVDQRIAIVDIDEKSLAEQGRWPWGRDRLALLMDKLFDRNGVRLVGFDVVFAEPDTSSGIKSLEGLAARDLRDNSAFQKSFRALRPRLDYDARFAAALKNRAVILGYYLSNGGQSSGVLPAPTLPAGSFGDRPIAFTTWRTHGGNLPVLQAAAAGAGHFNPLVDFDGISRRVPLLAEYHGEYYESLSLAVVRALLDFPPVFPGFAEGGDEYAGLEWLELPGPQDSLRIPVDENAAALIPYRGPQGSFPYISATDILNDRVAPEQLKDRIVLVGTTAPGLMDLRATPVAATYAGVEVHANLIAGILDGAIKHKPAYLLGADVVVVLLAGLVMIFLMPLLSPFKATLVALLVTLALAAINFAFWHSGNMVMPFANGAVLVTLLYALNMCPGATSSNPRSNGS
jgi:adenylate cyclase